MDEQAWGTDEELLIELGEALRSAGPLPAGHAAGRAAWASRRGSRFQSAALTFDSVLEDVAALRDVQNAQARMLTFATEDNFSLEVELGEDRLLGQIIPAVAGSVTTVTVEGSGETTVTDEVGCFGLSLPSGPFRLQFESPEADFITEWMRL